MTDLPAKFLDRLHSIFSKKEITQILKAFATHPHPSIRANTIKITTKALVKKLTAVGIELEPIPWYKDAFLVTNKTTRELTETKQYEEALFYIQNLSSMIPVLALAPQAGEHILDIAAAPGSKTTQIGAFMDNKGIILANDLSHKRLYKLRANLQQYGITTAKITNFPGQNLWKHYPEYFDRTLVDVPCTMEGRFRSDDPKTYEDWSTKKIKELAVRQKHLLRAAITATHPGGIIVYSTCTLAPEENEGVIDWILQKEKDAISIEPITIKGLTIRNGLTHWQKDFDPQIKNTARILPSETMEGFFIAKIKKLKSTLPIQKR